MGEVIVITSGKGGVGKTTTTANIGLGLATLGKSVVMIDLDLGLRNLDLLLGMEEQITHTLVDVVQGNCSPEEAMIHDGFHPNLHLIAAAQKQTSDSVTPQQMEKLTAELAERYDFVILDCPAGIEQGFQNAIAGAQRAIIVATPEVSSIRDADRVIGLLESENMDKFQLILNRVRPRMVRRGDMMTPESVVEMLAVELLGIIPDDEEVIVSSNRGEPLAGGGSAAGQAYMNICRRLSGESVPFMDLDARKGLFGLFHRG